MTKALNLQIPLNREFIPLIYFQEITQLIGVVHVLYL